MAVTPSQAAVGSIAWPRSRSSRMCRLVALSSTISTGTPRSTTGAEAALVVVMGATGKVAVIVDRDLAAPDDVVGGLHREQRKPFA